MFLRFKMRIFDKPIQEITLRRYERPRVKDERELIRKFCLSIGLLQPGDSRDVIVDILQVLLKEKDPISAKEIQRRVSEVRKNNNLPMQGIAESNIRRQIRRLKELMIIEKIGMGYQINENDSLEQIFETKIKPFLIENIEQRIKDYCKAIDEIRDTD